MAQTQTRTKRTGSTKSSGSTRSSGSRTKSSNSRTKSSNSRGRSASNNRTASRPRSNARNASNSRRRQSTVESVGRTVVEKAKVPLVAGGAALVGVAGAAVIAARSGRRRKVLGIQMPKRNGLKLDASKVAGAVSDAAKRTDQFAQRVSRVASGVQSVSETADEAVKKS